MADRNEQKTRSDSKNTPRFLACHKRSFEANPSNPYQLLQGNDMSLSTVSRAVNMDPGLTSCTWRHRHLLIVKVKAITAETPKAPVIHQVSRCWKRSSAYRREKDSLWTLRWIADIFPIIAFAPSDVPPIFRTKNLGSMMVYGATANDGSVMNPHFIGVGLKIPPKEYLDILKTFLLLSMEQNFGLDKCGADTGFKTKSYLKSNTNLSKWEGTSFVKADIWPSNNPHFNILYFFLWGGIQGRTNASRHSNIKSSCIVHAKCKIKKGEVAADAKQFRSRLEAVIAQEGGHIELWMFVCKNV